MDVKSYKAATNLNGSQGALGGTEVWGVRKEKGRAKAWATLEGEKKGAVRGGRGSLNI